MRSYKRYTRRKRLLKQIAVVALSPNRVFTKEQIYQHIYEEAESEVNNRIYGLIKNLRKKIEENPETPHYIETIRGVGYRFRAWGIDGKDKKFILEKDNGFIYDTQLDCHFFSFCVNY